jgi:hypothetical protein
LNGPSTCHGSGFGRREQLNQFLILRRRQTEPPDGSLARRSFIAQAHVQFSVALDRERVRRKEQRGVRLFNRISLPTRLSFSVNRLRRVVLVFRGISERLTELYFLWLARLAVFVRRDDLRFEFGQAEVSILCARGTLLSATTRREWLPTEARANVPASSGILIS